MVVNKAWPQPGVLGSYAGQLPMAVIALSVPVKPQCMPQHYGLPVVKPLCDVKCSPKIGLYFKVEDGQDNEVNFML